MNPQLEAYLDNDILDNVELGKAPQYSDAKDEASNIKKPRLWSFTLTVFLVLIMVGVLLNWNRGEEAIIETANASIAEPSIFVVQEQPVQIELDVIGTVSPAGLQIITAPFSGRVETLMDTNLTVVTKGQHLATLGVSELLSKYQEAKAEFVKTSINLKALEQWSNGKDMRASQRRVANAKSQVEQSRAALESTKELFNQGIVSKNEMHEVSERFTRAENVLVSANDELDETAKKGDKAFLELAQIAKQSAEEKMTALRIQISTSEIMAPGSGMLTTPPKSNEEGSASYSLFKGASVNAGQALFAIRKADEFMVVTYVDEVDVNQLKIGMPVMISSDAVPGKLFIGNISDIATEAVNSNFGEPSKFQVAVAFKTPKPSSGIRIGMSARMQITVYQNDNAIVIPHQAVLDENTGKFVTLIASDTGITKRVAVQTGKSFISGIEISSGLSSGETILLSE